MLLIDLSIGLPSGLLMQSNTENRRIIRRLSSTSSSSSTIRYRCSFSSNTIRHVLKGRGWKEGEDDSDWDLYWGDREWIYEIFDTMHLDGRQRLNHFRNSKELCRKDLLVKNLKKMKKQLDREGQHKESAKYDFFPVSFTLPRMWCMFVEEFKRVGGIWIMKPIGSAQGKGIFLFTRLSEISEWKYEFKAKTQGAAIDKEKDVETYIVQRYIANPYLLGQKKFDIRLYCLVTSFMPLTAFLFRDGFARFSQTRYSSDPADVANMFVHLTNVAVQKKSEDYDDRTGGKLDLRSLKFYLASKLGMRKVDALFYEMQMIIVRSLQAVQPVIIQDKHTFEIFGYDLLIDEDAKPWLIEVNASPSLSANTKLDLDLKTQMLNDALDIVDMEDKLDGDEMVVGGFYRLIHQNQITQHLLCRQPYRSILGVRSPPVTPIHDHQLSNTNNNNNKTPRSSRGGGEISGGQAAAASSLSSNNGLRPSSSSSHRRPPVRGGQRSQPFR